jgi:hypothetical protein
VNLSAAANAATLEQLLQEAKVERFTYSTEKSIGFDGVAVNSAWAWICRHLRMQQA